jgi:hypothetical protein
MRLPVVLTPLEIFEGKENTASRLVRNKVYPLPRARYFTWASVCPSFFSKASGSAAREA